VRCWGLNNLGELGNGEVLESAPFGRTAPVAVTGLGGVGAIAAGGFETCALLTDGTVRCWGSNGTGQLGIGDLEVRLSATPVRVVSFP
jgi:alpha-tubulin suppressor-like RCC1 family protein